MRTLHTFRWLSVTAILAILLSGVAGAAPAGRPETASRSDKIASTLGLLVSLSAGKASCAPDSALGREVANIRASGLIAVNARFARELSEAERAAIQALGVEFQTAEGEPAQLGAFYGLGVPPQAVAELAAHPLTVWLESSWRPVLPAPLDLSVTYAPGISSYVDAPTVWGMISPFTGLPLTGAGATVANFDTGVDVLHPAFLNGTNGAAYNNWDTNSDGVFTPNVDTIGGVILRYNDALGDPQNGSGILDITQDWIWGDSNLNWQYDFNERTYMAFDQNGSGILEAGEYLIDRGIMSAGIPTSKIAATLNTGGVTRVRGSDLHLTALDTSGHGTSVSGIIAAGAVFMGTMYGWPNIRRYTGMAPDADLLVADRLNNADTVYVPWAQNRGAQVMLYEFGGWVYDYLDGSSNLEQMMDQASDLGILQVVPTGNLHCGGTWGCNPRHLLYTLPGSSPMSHQFNVPATPSMTDLYASMLWKTPGNNLTVQLNTPGGSSTGLLPCSAPGGGWQYVNTSDGHQVGCERAANSSRGTALYNIWVYRAAGVATGNWTMWVFNGGTAEPAAFYIADSAGAWAFGAGWLNSGSGIEAHTATWPSTCDSCIGVASYATRANTIGTPGSLSWFSGRGPRFSDGAYVVDVAAPGHYDIITPQSRAVLPPMAGYNGTFGGTSAAGPHAAGLAALLYQFTDGDITTANLAGALRRGAASDGFTGAVPNPNWGYGKLRAPETLFALMHDLGDAPASDNHAGTPMTAYPGVTAHFPTVFDAAVPGPLHWTAGSIYNGFPDSWLGYGGVSAEGEADILYDEDTVPNIQPAGDMADLDQADGGLIFPGPLPHCAPANTTVLAFLQNYHNPNPVRYLNVWVDWNADGDWQDVLTCGSPGDTPEWVLQNYLVSGVGLHPVSVAMQAYRGGTGGDPLWMRATLSEQMAPIDPGSGRADGRGPAAGYDFGETEDYLYPQTSFLAPASACVSDTVVFSHSVASSWPVTFTWDFGDGVIVTNPGPNPAHHYAVPGLRNVILTAASSSGAFSVYTKQVLVETAPGAGFTSDSPVCLGETMHFTDTSQGAQSWEWDFGGPGTPGGTPQNPTFLYSASGDYDVTLDVTNTCGADDCQAGVSVWQPVDSVSIAGPASLLVGEVGTYTATLLPPDAEGPWVLWDNGDTSSTTSRSWDTPGQYTVAVTAGNACGAVSATLAVLVSGSCISLTGVSIAGPASLQVGEEGTYTASPEPPTATNPAYLWSDGSVYESAVYSWTTPGTYPVEVTASNCQGVTVSDTVSVVVTSGCVSLTAVTIAGPAVLLPDEVGTFTAAPAPPTATNPAYLWDNGLAGSSATYSWPAAGEYTVTVTATNCLSIVVRDDFRVVVQSESAFRIFLPLVQRNGQ